MSFFSNLARKAAQSFDPGDCSLCPKIAPGADPAFATAVTALGAKLAMADGWAREVEQTAFLSVFQPQEARARADVLKLYDLARQTALGFESYATRLAKRYNACPQILEDVLEGLFHIAVSDGALTDAEETYLEKVAELFGLSAAIYRRIKAGYIESGPHDPYFLLEVPYDAEDEVIRKARRDRLRDVHPDRVVARGLPAEYVKLYTEKAALINRAFDQIMTERAVLTTATGTA